MPTSTGMGGLAYLNAETRVPLTGPVDVTTTGSEAPIVITCHQTARDLLKDQRWRREPAIAHNLVGPASAMSITNMDTPRHGTVRSLVRPMFSRRAIGGLRERAHHRAHELCDQLVQAGPPADLVSQFCGHFTFAVHCDLLGIPEHARDAIRQASLRRSGRPDATARETYEAEMAMHSDVKEVLAYLRSNGGHGVYPQLIRSPRVGLDNAEELAGLASSLLFDGHILTSSQIANTIAALLCYPAVRSAAVGQEGLRPTAREEFLRWSPAITLGMPRRASMTLRLGETIVREGQTAVVAFGMVNRDPAVFDHSESLDLGRHPNRHLAFGYGAHYCLGAHLARLQLDVAVNVLLCRLPGLRLAGDERILTWSASHTIRRLNALPVVWHREASTIHGSPIPPLHQRESPRSHASGAW